MGIETMLVLFQEMADTRGVPVHTLYPSQWFKVISLRDPRLVLRSKMGFCLRCGNEKYIQESKKSFKSTSSSMQ